MTLEDLLDIENTIQDGPGDVEMCECGVLPAPCGCDTVVLDERMVP